MRVARVGSAARVRADVLVVPLADGERLPASLELPGPIRDALEAERADGRLRFGQLARVRALGQHPCGAVAVAGLGSASDLDQTRLVNALHLAFRTLAPAERRVAVAWSEPGGAAAAAVATAAVEAAVLAGFSEATHKSRPRDRDGVASLTLAGFPTVPVAALDRARVLGEATNLARELVNLPGADLTPRAFAARARREAAAAGLRCEVLGLAELRRLRYGGMVAVAGGSAHPPQLVVLRHGGKRRSGERLALVGKGVTFDTGGISIKPGPDMHHMKADMGGAAAVLGAMVAIARAGVEADVVGILCIAENMVGPAAIRPGDVLRTGSGKTVEVINTDAEGRLVLADGLHHAVRLGATQVVDIATLTGAQRLMLGGIAAAMWGNDATFTARVKAAAEAAGERLWEMPLYPEWANFIESPIADFTNSFGPEAAASLAALFLREFSGGVPWVHLDIASPSWNWNPKLRQVPQGPTGYGVRTMYHLAAGAEGAGGRPRKVGRKIR